MQHNFGERHALNQRGRQSRKRRRWIAIAIIVAGSFLFVAARVGDLAATFVVLGQLQPGPLLVAVTLSAVAVVNRGGMSRSAQRAVGLNADLGSMTRVSAAAYALNKVVRSAGLGGIALFVRHGEKRQHPPGQVTAAYVLASLAAQVALLAIVLGSIAAMAIGGALTGTWLLAAALVTVAGIGAIAILAVAVRNRAALRAILLLPHRMLSTIARWRGRPAPAPIDVEHADRFYDAAAAVRQHPRAAIPVLAHAVVGKLLGAGVLVASLAATGASLSFAKALTVYALALIAAVVGIVPGGVGLVEASMGALLAGYGVTASVAIAAVLTFRLLDLWLPLLVGLAASRGLKALPACDAQLAKVRASSDALPAR